MALAGCVPVPVSTVPLHPREARPIAVESAPSENHGVFSAPAFDASGTLLAAYDSGRGQVRILRSSDLTPVNSLKPARRPRRLSFSPGGHFLVIEAYQGWIEDYLRRKLPSGHIDLSSPEAVRDNIQRVEVWNLQTGQTIPDLGCDAAVTSEPQGGWLWARNWAITPGYRSSAVLAAHFSADEKQFTILGWNGVQQRWDSRTWQRLESLPPPPFWKAVMGPASAAYLTENGATSRSADGRVAVLSVREKNFGFSTVYLWDRTTSEARRLPGDYGARGLPVYCLSSDGRRLAVICSKDLGHSVRVWDLGSGREISLQEADFGLASGAPLLRSEGVALSPDGRYLAVALPTLNEALLVPAPVAVSRSDLRLWSLENGRELVAVPIDELAPYADYFRGVDLAISPDSATLAVAGTRLRIYRMSELVTRSP